MPMTRKQQHRYYDQHKRNKESKAFYNSKAWKDCRTAVLKRDHYLCQHCLEQKKIKKADTVHHIIHLLDDWSKALEMVNLISLCHECHNKEHPEKGGGPKKNDDSILRKRIRVVKV